MSTSPTHLRSLYRSILRELPPRPLLRAPRTPLHSRLRESIVSSSPNNKTTTSASASEVKRAEQVIAYVRSQRQYVTLVERYNPGMNMDEEERIRLTARRVGMNLPVEFVNEKD